MNANRTVRGALRQSDAGFILAAVLWVLAGLSLLAALVNDVTQTTALRVEQLRARADFVQEQNKQRSILVHWLANSVSLRSGFTDGLAYVSGGAVPYAWGQDSSVQVQELGGLLSLNTPNRELMARLLSNCGVPTEQTPFLLDALEDYIDTDSLNRINGAEKDTYARVGMPGPRDDKLLATNEVFNVFGWQAQRSKLKESGCMAAFAAPGPSGSGGAINFTTAPPAVLIAAGIEGKELESLLLLRSSVGSDAAAAVAYEASMPNQSGLFGVGGYAQSSMYVTQQQRSKPWTYEYTLEFVPRDGIRPWVIHQPKIEALKPELIQREAPRSRWPDLTATDPLQNVPNRLPF